MLEINILQSRDGEVNVTFDSKETIKAPRLKDSLKRFEITNPLITFSNRYTGKYYSDRPEDEIQLDAWTCDTLSVFWKESPEDIGQPKADVMTVLSRMADMYLKEHEELLELRERQ